MNDARNESRTLVDLSPAEIERVEGGLGYGELPGLQINTQETMLASFYEVRDQPRTVTVSLIR